MDYNGPREKVGLVNWVKKKTQPPTSLLSDVEALEKAKTDNNVLVVLFTESEDTEEFNAFRTVA